MAKQTPPPAKRTAKKETIAPKPLAKVISSVTSVLDKNDWIAIVLVGILGFVLYFNTTKFGYTFDDDIYTLKSKYALEGTKAMKDIWGYGTIKGFTVAPNNSGIYRPFTLMTFAIEKDMFGKLEPKHSHLVNIFLYALMLGFLCSLLIKLFKNITIPTYIPIIISVLFALHPLHTEVVASVKSRDEILAMLLPLIAFNLLWTHLRQSNLPALIGALLLFFFAVASKENALTLIAVLPLMLFLFGKKDAKDAFMASLPFMLVAFFYLIVRVKILDKDNSSGVNMIANNIIWGAKGSDVLATNFSVWLEYLRLLVIPHPLSYDYSFNQIPIVSMTSMRTIISFILHVGLMGYGLWAISKHQMIGFGILFYFLTFSIFTNIIPKFVLASTMAERFLFMPSLGFCIALVVAVYLLLNKLNIAQSKYITIAIFAGISLVYGYLTLKRTPVWESNRTLFESGLTTSPNSFRTHYNMAETERVAGEALKLEGEKEKNPAKVAQAKEYLKKAANHYETSFKIYDKESNPWYNLGICYLNTQDTLKAEKAYQNALDKNQQNGMAANNLGVMQFWKKDFKKAAEYFEIAVKGNNPEMLNAYSNLGAAYQNMGNLDKAIESYDKAMQMGGSAVVVQNLVNVYTAKGDVEKANYYRAMLK